MTDHDVDPDIDRMIREGLPLDEDPSRQAARVIASLCRANAELGALYEQHRLADEKTADRGRARHLETLICGIVEAMPDDVVDPPDAAGWVRLRNAIRAACDALPRDAIG